MAVGASYVQAQESTLRGVVTDAAGFPLSNAEIRIMSEHRVARTDSAGAFVITQVKSRVVELTVQRMGYRLKIVHVALTAEGHDVIRIRLEGQPVILQSVDVESRNTEGANHPFFVEFERRRRLGLGTFIVRKQIEDLHSSYPSDAFRSLPGMRIVRVNGGSGIRFQSTGATRGRGGTGECQPMIWVDGQRAPGLEIDDIGADDIQAIEIYRGASTLPMQFTTSGLNQCGAIVVWTRRK